MKSLLDLAKDPYERKARITPGLLVALPVFVPLLCAYGPRHPVLASILGLLGGCGATYALASVARGKGKKLEERLVRKWGGMPSTIALRHRDTFFDRVTKNRYHEAIVAKLGIPMPTPDEEAANPAMADDVYIGVTRRLREVTRENKSLLLKENIAYGFHRNMLAMKTVGIFSCLLGILYGLLIAKAIQFTPPFVFPSNLTDPTLAVGLTLSIAVVLLLTWIFYFNGDAVRRIGFVYAERLFECLSSLPNATARRRAAK